MQRERMNPLKIGAYLLVLLTVYLLQTSFGLKALVFGYHIDLMPAVVASVALMDGPQEGAILGVIAGILYDTSVVSIEGLYPAFYMVFGVAAGFLSKRYLRKMFASALILSSCAMLLINALRYVFYLYMMKKTGFLFVFQTLCAEVLVAAAFSPLVYYPIKKLSLKFKDT